MKATKTANTSSGPTDVIGSIGMSTYIRYVKQPTPHTYVIGSIGMCNYIRYESY